MFSRHSASSRFRGDRANALELLGLLALALVVVMLANDAVSSRVLGFFSNLLQAVH